jgi:hypothetical protein
MPPARITHQMTPTMQALHTAGSVPIRPRPVRSHRSSLRVTLRRLHAAVVNGSDNRCWRTPDPSAQLALLPPREQNRLLDSGRVPRNR